MALGVGVGLDRRREPADARVEIGQQPGQLAAAGAERGAQVGGLHRPRELVERLHERPVGRAHDRIAGAVEHAHALACRLARELAHQPALAGARLAPEQDDMASFAVRQRHQRAQPVELSRTADERERRHEVERGREIVHAQSPYRRIVRCDHSRWPSPCEGRAKSVRSRHDTTRPFRDARVRTEPPGGLHEQSPHSRARRAARADRFRGAADRPRGPRLRRGPQGLQRDDRQAARADRALRRPRRRGQGDRLRARARPAARRPRRRAQRRRAGDVRRRRRDRPLAAARHRGRPAGAHRPRRRRLHVGRGRPRDRRARPGDPERHHLDHRRRRPHARRRPRPPDARVRAGDRQPARGRARARERRARPCERGRAPRPVLGDPRRRRQLRRRHVVPVPPARGGEHLRRPDVLGRRGRAPRCSRPTASSCRARRASSTASSRSARCRRPRRSPRSSTCARSAASCGATSGARRTRPRRWRRCSTPRRSRSCTACSRCRISALQSAFDGLYPAGDQWYWRADFVNEIPDAAVDIHARFGAELPTPKSTMHLYPIDGAAHDVDSADTAWSYRDASWGAVFAGVDPDPANVERDPASGRSTTSRRCTRTRRAAPT